MATLRIDGVSKRYGACRALEDFSLEVADGELMVLVGPSGCGKSTLLRLLAGLETADAGAMAIDGRAVDGLPPQARNVAMVFQNYALYPHMTVRRNLEFPLRMQGRARAAIAARVAAVAGLLELDALLERRPGELSGGQRQRVAMGRALVREPAVFLLDEPLSNLDARLRVRMRGEIAALQRRLGATMLYVTHDQAEAMTLGDRVAVLDHGRLQQVAAPGALYRHPANTIVAGFVGSPGMNLFTTTLCVRADGAPAIRWGGRALPIPGGGGLRAQAGRTVCAGLRPEAFHAPVLGDSTVTARVAAVETLGHERLIHFRAEVSPIAADPAPGGEPLLVARLADGFRLRAGMEVELGVDLRGLRLFDAAGNALWPGAEGGEASGGRSEEFEPSSFPPRQGRA